MIRLRVLGESVVEIGENRVGPEATTVFALALLLAFECDVPVTRQTLTDYLWPDSRADRARHCLRQTLYKLRQLGAPIRATASHVELSGADVTGEFLELAGGVALAPERLRRAGSSFGEFLPGYAPELSSRFTEWLDERRDHVHSIVRRALAAALLDSRTRHRWADVELVARHYLRLDPLNEEATLAIAEATALTGSKAQALSMLDQYLGELGPGASEIKLPAAMLRRRIAERVPERRYAAVADACFVGRDESVEALAGLLREARAGRGQACLIWGEAGIGKTRLAAECSRAAALQGAQVLRVGCEASDVRRPLSLFVDAVPLLLNLRGALGCSPASMTYLRRLTEHDPDAQSPSDAARDADFLFARVRRSIFDLVDAVAGEGTLVFVVEDVHWLDQTSWEVVRAMIDWAASRKLLFLFTSRTEHPTGVAQEAPSMRLVRHHLAAIADGAAEQLLDALCEGAEPALGAELREWFVRVAEGNPLFLRELASEWVEGGARRRLPYSILQVIRDRLGRLSAPALRLLQASGVLSSNSTFQRLERLLQFTDSCLLESVSELEQAALIDPSAIGIAAKHDLIRDEAMYRLTPAATKLLHRQCSQLLAREIESSKSPTLLWDCARHLQECGEVRPMMDLVHMCATHLLELGLPADAAALFAQGAEYSDDAEVKADLLRGQANALRSAGLWKHFASVTSRLSELRSLSCPLLSSHTDDELARLEGEIKADLPFTELYLRAMSCLEDSHASCAHRVGAGAIALRLADQMGSIDCASHVFAVVQSLREPGEAATTDSVMCDLVFHSSYGDLDQAERAATTLVALERTEGSPLGLVRALRFAQIPLLRNGKWALAFASVREALTQAERHRLPNAATYAMDDLATLCLEADDVSQAEYWYYRADAPPAPKEDAYLLSSLRHLGARLSIARNTFEEGRRRFATPIDRLLRDQFTQRKLANLTTWLRLTGPRHDDEEGAGLLAMATKLFSQLSRRGGQDHNAASLTLALWYAGEKERAYSMLHEYARDGRRERGAMPHYLATALRIVEEGRARS